MPGFNETPHLRDHLPSRHRARVSATVGNDTEGTAVVAAILHLHIGARPPVHSVDQVRGSLAHAHDVVDADFFLAAQQLERRPGLRLHLLVVADDPRHFRHRREGARIDLRRAARDEDRRAGILLCRPPDRLARPAHSLAGHRAGIDDHRLAEASLQRMAAHHLGLIGVEAASEGNHRRARRRGGIRHLGVFNVPRAAANQGVVSMSRCASSEAPHSRIRSTADSRQVSMYPVGALPSGR